MNTLTSGGLTDDLMRTYDAAGHVTVDGVFDEREIAIALEDVLAWAMEFSENLDEDQRRWYMEAAPESEAVLRKLDNPHFHRPVFRALAEHPDLVACVESLIGRGISVYFSQIFFKPPHGGGPKPVHQDNFYFGPSDPEGVVTAWIAMDEATTENGCLYFGDGTHKGPVFDHVAPPDEPFNLQVPADIAARHRMTPAPVKKGGVSFHHGTVLHQSSDNNSDKWRRACALHYVSNGNVFETPGLEYDNQMVTKISG